MSNIPSTRHRIPNWLIITLATFVVVVGVVAVNGGVSQVLQAFGHVSTTVTTSKRDTEPKNPNEMGRPDEIVEETTEQTVTGWDFLSILIIPVAGGLIVVLAGNWFNRRQREREETVQSLRAQDEILQKYLDQISDLVVNEGLRPKPADLEPENRTKPTLADSQTENQLSDFIPPPADPEPESHIRKLAQARTIAALLGLDSAHKRRPLKLVYELGLIEKGNGPLELKNAGLDGADLSELTLRGAYLKCADLRLSDLKGADLEGANLHLTDLRGSDLSRADLKDADLREANLLPYDEQDPERWSYHNLTKEIFVNPKKLTTEKLSPRRLKWGRELSKGLPWYRFRRLTLQGLRPKIVKLTLTNLKGATLENALLNETWLGVTDLTNADLTNADLTNAVGITGEELVQQAYSLKGATLPNGQKYEEWVNSRKGQGG